MSNSTVHFTNNINLENGFFYTHSFKEQIRLKTNKCLEGTPEEILSPELQCAPTQAPLQ